MRDLANKLIEQGQILPSGPKNALEVLLDQWAAKNRTYWLGRGYGKDSDWMKQQTSASRIGVNK